jgi:hypothetical protein
MMRSGTIKRQKTNRSQNLMGATMSELQAYRTMIDAASSELKKVIEVVPEQMFGARPEPDANPASFVYFHVLRHWDRDINMHVRGQEATTDAWHRHGLTDTTGYSPDGKGYNGMGTGYGYSAADVDEVPPNKDALMQYHRILKEETDQVLDTLDDDSIHVERVLAAGATITPAARFRHLIAHTFVHIGDIEYIKGLVGAPASDVPNVG